MFGRKFCGELGRHLEYHKSRANQCPCFDASDTSPHIWTTCDGQEIVETHPLTLPPACYWFIRLILLPDCSLPSFYKRWRGKPALCLYCGTPRFIEIHSIFHIHKHSESHCQLPIHLLYGFFTLVLHVLPPSCFFRRWEETIRLGGHPYIPQGLPSLRHRHWYDVPHKIEALHTLTRSVGTTSHYLGQPTWNCFIRANWIDKQNCAPLFMVNTLAPLHLISMHDDTLLPITWLCH